MSFLISLCARTIALLTADGLIPSSFEIVAEAIPNLRTPRISPSRSKDRFEERVRLTSLSSSIDSRIEPGPFRPETFVDEDPLAWEIKRKGIRVDLEVEESASR
jgi:hypothetical protein